MLGEFFLSGIDTSGLSEEWFSKISSNSTRILRTNMLHKQAEYLQEKGEIELGYHSINPNSNILSFNLKNPLGSEVYEVLGSFEARYGVVILRLEFRFTGAEVFVPYSENCLEDGIDCLKILIGRDAAKPREEALLERD